MGAEKTVQGLGGGGGGKEATTLFVPLGFSALLMFTSKISIMIGGGRRGRCFIFYACL